MIASVILPWRLSLSDADLSYLGTDELIVRFVHIIAIMKYIVNDVMMEIRISEFENDKYNEYISIKNESGPSQLNKMD